MASVEFKVLPPLVQRSLTFFPELIATSSFCLSFSFAEFLIYFFLTVFFVVIEIFRLQFSLPQRKI